MYNFTKKIACSLNKALDNRYPLNKLRYGIELLLTQFILFISMFIISIISNTPFELFFFMIPLILIRTFSGGYHSKSFFECFIITNCVCFISIYLSKIIDNYLFYVCITIFSYIIICLFSPVTNKNLSITNLKLNKLIAFFTSSFFTVLVLFNNILRLQFINIFSYVLLAVAVSILISFRFKLVKMF